jgi:hypothetical protein
LQTNPLLVGTVMNVNARTRVRVAGLAPTSNGVAPPIRPRPTPRLIRAVRDVEAVALPPRIERQGLKPVDKTEMGALPHSRLTAHKEQPCTKIFARSGRGVIGRSGQLRLRPGRQQPARGRSASRRFPNGEQNAGSARSRRRPAIVSSVMSATSAPDATRPGGLDRRAGQRDRRGCRRRRDQS